MAFITKPEVEKKNVQRVILKARERLHSAFPQPFRGLFGTCFAYSTWFRTDFRARKAKAFSQNIALGPSEEPEPKT